MDINSEHLAALKHNYRQVNPNASNVLVSDWAAERYVDSFVRLARKDPATVDRTYDMVYTVAVDLD